MQKDANLVELEKCCQTHIFLQNFVLIQPRTSPQKICKILLILLIKKKVISKSKRGLRAEGRQRRVGACSRLAAHRAAGAGVAVAVLFRTWAGAGIGGRFVFGGLVASLLQVSS